MPLYDRTKPPTRYPKAFHEALYKAFYGGLGQEFRTFFKTFPPKAKRASASLQLSGYKASLRNHPGHELCAAADLVGTRMDWEPCEAGFIATIVSWKKFKPAGLVQEALCQK